MDLFDNLCKMRPLRPIATVEEYDTACRAQEMLIGNPDRGPWAELYLTCLNAFMDAYERGLKP